MRTAEITRNTNETRIRVAVNLDGTGKQTIDTGVPFLDHMLDQIARHGLIDLDIKAEGDLHIDAHHTVEDVGITLGMAIAKAVGNKAGLRRYGHAYVPLDEALSRVVVDFSGRPPGISHPLHPRPHRRLRRGPDARILPGPGQPRPDHAAHRQPARRQCPPPVRNGLQGLWPRPAWPSRSTRAWATSCRPPRACCNVHDLPHRIRQTELTTIAIVDYGMGNFHSVARALRYAAPTPTSASATSPMRSTRPTGSCSRPGRHGRLHAHAERIRPARGGRAPRAPSRCWACAWANRCCSTAARRRHALPGDLPGRGASLRRPRYAPVVTGEGEACASDAGQAGAAPTGAELLKVPHMGWNKVRQTRSHPVWAGIPDETHFYFVHSYYADPADPGLTVGETDYGVSFTCAVAAANIFAVQFHPEKSAEHGLRLYRNFVDWQP